MLSKNAASLVPWPAAMSIPTNVDTRLVNDNENTQQPNALETGAMLELTGRQFALVTTSTIHRTLA